MSLFDSHCHFDFPPFAGQQALLWQQCQAHNINRLLIPGTHPGQWPQAAALADTLPGVLVACGLHPWWIKDCGLSPVALADAMRRFISGHPVHAIGECGLDAMIDTAPEIQQDYLAVQLQLACDLSLPLILHVRKTHNAMQALLRHYRPPAGGVIHGFSGSLQQALQYWQMGFYLGIGGVITWPRARKTRAAVQQLPLAALLLETDAPDMPLHGHGSEANSPLNLPRIASELASLRGEPLALIEQQTSSNSCRLFRVPHV